MTIYYGNPDDPLTVEGEIDLDVLDGHDPDWWREQQNLTGMQALAIWYLDIGEDPREIDWSKRIHGGVLTPEDHREMAEEKEVALEKLRARNRERGWAVRKVAPPQVREPLFSPDALLYNADWTKQTWDLGIDNIDDLHDYLGQGAIQPGMTGTEALAAIQAKVGAFKKLPVYKNNVDKPGMEWLGEL